jgi:periplasmic protein CpxP/Spy
VDNGGFPDRDSRPHRGPPPGPGFGQSPGSERGWDAPPPFLAGLDLSDDQEDKVFGILYAAAPAIREQTKTLRKSNEALWELVTSTQYDDLRTKSLAESSAKAESQLALLRIRAEHEIFALLTPAQRALIVDRHGEREPLSNRGLPPR